MGVIGKVPVDTDKLATADQFIDVRGGAPIDFKNGFGFKGKRFTVQIDFGIYIQYLLYQGIL
jgi:hypothetical protein